MDLLNLLPKIPIKGSVHIEFKSCGRQSCQCNRGLLHGPYAYRHWREGEKQQKAYIPLSQLGNYLDALEAMRAAFPKRRDIRRVLRELRNE